MIKVVFIVFCLYCNQAFSQGDFFRPFEDTSSFFGIEEKAEQSLIKKLSDYKNNIPLKVSDKWYCDNSLGLRHSFDGEGCGSLASCELRTYFLICNIFTQRYEDNNKYSILIDTITNTVIYDYIVLDDNFLYNCFKSFNKDNVESYNLCMNETINCTVCNIIQINQIRREYSKWIKQMNNKGLAYLREKRISPLANTSFKWVVLDYANCDGKKYLKVPTSINYRPYKRMEKRD